MSTYRSGAHRTKLSVTIFLVINFNAFIFHICLALNMLNKEEKTWSDVYDSVWKHRDTYLQIIKQALNPLFKYISFTEYIHGIHFSGIHSQKTKSFISMNNF